MEGMVRRRIVVRLAVVATALLCLGMAGYAGQVLWARRIAERLVSLEIRYHLSSGSSELEPTRRMGRQCSALPLETGTLAWRMARGVLLDP